MIGGGEKLEETRVQDAGVRTVEINESGPGCRLVRTLPQAHVETRYRSGRLCAAEHAREGCLKATFPTDVDNGARHTVQHALIAQIFHAQPESPTGAFQNE